MNTVTTEVQTNTFPILSALPLNFVSFDREFYEDNCRYYVKNDDFYPSVTTLLSAFEDKTFLSIWRQRVGNFEADKQLEEAIDRGKSVHSFIEEYQTTGKLIATADYSKRTTAAIDYFYKHIDNVASEEAILYNDGSIRYAGRIDTVANILPNTFYFADDYTTVEPGLSVIDLKTKDKSQPLNTMDRMFKYALQGAAYIKGIEQLNPGVTVKYFIIVYSYKTKARMVLFSRELILTYFSMYYDLVYSYITGIELPLEKTWKKCIQKSNLFYDSTNHNLCNYLPTEILPFTYK